MNILLVEDDTIAAIAAEELLTDKFDYQVDVAKNGTEAVKFAKEKNYKLIFMDIGLPDISGFEATRQIKNHADSLNHATPIIALTGHINTNTKAEGIAAGMTEILEKPLNKTKIIELFEKIS